jgi:hypothetical protein
VCPVCLQMWALCPSQEEGQQATDAILRWWLICPLVAVTLMTAVVVVVVCELRFHLSLALRPVEKRCEAGREVGCRKRMPAWVIVAKHIRPIVPSLPMHAMPNAMSCKLRAMRASMATGGRGEIRGGLEGHLSLFMFMYTRIARLFAKACIAFVLLFPIFLLFDLTCRFLFCWCRKSSTRACR